MTTYTFKVSVDVDKNEFPEPMDGDIGQELIDILEGSLYDVPGAATMSVTEVVGSRAPAKAQRDNIL
jgi:hypothetical protein